MTKSEAVKRLERWRATAPEDFYADGIIKDRKVKKVNGSLLVESVFFSADVVSYNSANHLLNDW
jgi:hypothetical protein